MDGGQAELLENDIKMKLKMEYLRNGIIALFFYWNI